MERGMSGHTRGTRMHGARYVRSHQGHTHAWSAVCQVTPGSHAHTERGMSGHTRVRSAVCQVTPGSHTRTERGVSGHTRVTRTHGARYVRSHTAASTHPWVWNVVQLRSRSRSWRRRVGVGVGKGRPSLEGEEGEEGRSKGVGVITGKH